MLYLLSGLFLGWSLGANDAANVFGTAVSTKMLRFRTAAWLCCIFIVLGAVIGGKGTSDTLGSFSAIPFISGSFTVALACALTLFIMTIFKLPVSSSQAIIGALIGWNLFAGHPTDLSSLGNIASSWIVSPVLAAVFSAGLYMIMRYCDRHIKINILFRDMLTRWGLIIIGVFGAYSLGANNIANVIGVFIPANPFHDIQIAYFSFSSLDILLFIGGISIAIGVATYSKNVMLTVGSDIFALSPLSGFIVVASSSLVLFFFASVELKHWLISHGLPSFPLVPVSSSQVVVGAVMGIGMIRNITTINWKLLGKISIGWLTTPVMACLVSLLLLFIVQNVFTQSVYEHTVFVIKPQLREKVASEIPSNYLAPLDFKRFTTENSFINALEKYNLDKKRIDLLLQLARSTPMHIDKTVDHPLFGEQWLTPAQIASLRKLAGTSYTYRWEFEDVLQKTDPSWQFRPDVPANKTFNEHLRKVIDRLVEAFSAASIIQ